MSNEVGYHEALSRVRQAAFLLRCHNEAHDAADAAEDYELKANLQDDDAEYWQPLALAVDLLLDAIDRRQNQ